MKKAVIYGAGNIGRGFIGQLFTQSGYEAVFVDVVPEVVRKLNADRCYPLRFVSEKGNREITVSPVRAVDGRDTGAVAAEIGDADLMATAVGVAVLPAIAGPIAAGLRLRRTAGNLPPLDIIICENMIDAGRHLKSLVERELDPGDRGWLDASAGFVEASIGRMVPVVTPAMQEGNILRVWVEEYGKLPVDRDGFRGAIPEIAGMLPFSPFEYHIRRKLFVHNMGHAVTAYLGAMKGFAFIWRAILDPEIRRTTRAAMMESAQALSAEYGVAIGEIEEHVDDLIERFGNRQLGDTVLRVGRDLPRKLAPGDRLAGAVNFCVGRNIEPVNICRGLAAALRFRDPMGDAIGRMVAEEGPERVLAGVCGLRAKTMEWNLVQAALEEQDASGAQDATGAGDASGARDATGARIDPGDASCGTGLPGRRND